MITFKLVLNKCHGGFQLSDKALEKLSELTGKKVSNNDYAEEWFTFSIYEDEYLSKGKQ